MLRFPFENKENLRENIVYDDFDTRAETFVTKMLDGYKSVSNNEIKVIHDPIWGTIKFYPWELQLLDSPLLQRLRNVNQVGLAVLTYPSAHHSRFEHTLGVTALITKMVDSVNDDFCSDCSKKENAVVSFSDLTKLRIAAILHDIGHCFFSHLSERMYCITEEFKELKNAFEIFSKAQPHEILGYIIINTKAFKSFFKSMVNYPEKINNDSFFDDIGRMIVGAPIDTIYCENGQAIKKYYLTEMINGQFDADSLDYLRRDSYITGLSLTYHIDRFLYKIKIVECNETINGEKVIGKHLTVSQTGVSTIEEMIFDKQMLTRYIYQHQKVLAADALIYDVVNGLKSNGKLQHPCDFLYYRDDDIYKIYDESYDADFRVPIYSMPINSDSTKTISDVVKQIKDRNLPKKALVINMSNIATVNDNKNPTLYDVYEALQKVVSVDNFRKAVRDKAWQICDMFGFDKSQIDLFDIFYSVPKPSTAKNYTDVYVATREGGFVELSEVADLNNWADEFSTRSWNAYVFSNSELLNVVGVAAEKVFEDRGITFNEKIFSGLKHLKDIEDLLNKLNSNKNKL